MAKSPSQTSTLVALADELGALECELAPLKPKIARIELLRSTLRAAYADHDATQAYKLEGRSFVLSVGPRADEKRVHVGKLMLAIGIKPFLTLCTVTLKALTEAVPRVVPASVSLACIVETANSGVRPLKIFAKADLPKAMPVKRAA